MVEWNSVGLTNQRLLDQIPMEVTFFAARMFLVSLRKSFGVNIANLIWLQNTFEKCRISLWLNISNGWAWPSQWIFWFVCFIKWVGLVSLLYWFAYIWFRKLYCCEIVKGNEALRISEFSESLLKVERHDLMSAYYRRLTGENEAEKVLCAHKWSK